MHFYALRKQLPRGKTVRLPFWGREMYILNGWFLKEAIATIFRMLLD
jgi:hypothetical protein